MENVSPHRDHRQLSNENSQDGNGPIRLQFYNGNDDLFLN